MELLLVCLLAPEVKKPPATVALVLHAGQGATLQRGKEAALALCDLDLLRDGDVVRAGKEAVRLVVLGDGHGASVYSGKTVTLGKAGCSPPASFQKVERKLGRAALDGLRELARTGRASGAVVRGGRGGVSGLVVPLPGARVLGPSPIFRWPAVKGALRYSVRLYSGEGDDRKFQWQEPARENVLPWPKGRPPLPAGASRSWDVVAHLADNDELLVVSGSELTIATAEERKGLDELAALARNSDGDSRLLAAVLYEEREAFDAALSVYQELARQRPAPVGVLRGLYRLHRRAGDRAGAAALAKRLAKRGVKVETK